jgi:DNA polymerase-3 subunit gamma/tau
MSCTEIAAGSSLDVHELDAASNNGVDAMRDLVARTALGTPGRWKVYIVDEVHMLSPAASNALLKTLEEPPSHVLFVLATTDPQKVLQTIRSRTQHFEFRLIGPETLHQLLETIRDEAKLDLPEHAIEMAVSRGRGSARDALSVLDQVAAAGIVEPDTAYIAQLAEALATKDPQAALVALAGAVSAGRDPLLVAGELADHLRQSFLSVVAPELVTLDANERQGVSDLAAKMGLAAIVRAVEALGTVQVDMRESPDPRLHVEVCLLRLTRAEVDDSLPGLLERVERLERGQTSAPAATATATTFAAPAVTVPTSSTPTPAQSDVPQHSEAPPAETGSGLYSAPSPEPEAEPRVPVGKSPKGQSESEQAESGTGQAETGQPETGPSSGPALARRSLGAIRREAAARRGAPESSGEADHPGDAIDASASADAGAAGSEMPSPAEGAFPTRDQLVQVWGDGLLASLPQRARARFRVGRFMEVENGVAVFALPNESHRSYCEEVIQPVEDALSAKFGVKVKLRLINDPDEDAGGRPSVRREAKSDHEVPVADDPPPDRDEPDLLDPHVLQAETELAGEALSLAERLKLTFPGAQEV